MSCEDTTTTPAPAPAPARISWEIDYHEPHSGVWIIKAYGRATTTAAPADIARAVLAGHLTAYPPPHGETFRATVRRAGGPPVTVTSDQLPEDGWKADAAVCDALPTYLREALA